MVERVSKPEAPPAYYILPAKEAKDDKSRREQHEEGEEHYQKSAGKGNWEKFRGRAMTIKPVRVPRDRIDRILFKNVILRSGVAILEAAVVWKDGRTTESALFLMAGTEDFMKLKKFRKGQVVPESFWVKGPEIEMGIVQAESPSGSWSIRELEREAKEPEPGRRKMSSWLSKIGLRDPNTRRFQWFVLMLYVLGLVIIALAVFYALK
jgi:hypothetical protein